MPGTWIPLVRQPRFCASAMLLLTDGSVLCQQVNGRQWFKLTPDATGNYVNGTWSAVASARDPRLYFASAVLRDGTVFVAGGEYSGGATEDEIAGVEQYDPVTDSWMPLPSPIATEKMGMWSEVGDAPCCVLSDGRILLGSITDGQTAIFDPISQSWSGAANKLDGNSTEESWTLLVDGSVLAVDCSGSQRSAERYVPELDEWIATDNIPVRIVATDDSKEMGPAVLMADGRVFVVGATGHTALFASDPALGNWVAGPDFPAASDGTLRGGKDSPCCLLPNGKVLCSVASVATTKEAYPAPTLFFEFDGTGFAPVTAPPSAGGAPYQGCLLLLPTGQVMFSAQGPEIYVYTPDGNPQPEWKPTIIDCPRRISPGTKITLSGRQLNGRSQAVAYGDDYAAATNYPIVRLEFPNGTVRYCRTFNHSTMGVATGASIVSTEIEVPSDVGGGLAQLVVIANGIPSDSFTVTVDGAQLSAVDDPITQTTRRPVLVIAGRTIGQILDVGIGYVKCGIYAACNWTFALERESYITLKQECIQTRDNGYASCTQTRDDGYNQCTQTRDDGYRQCCTWWPCSWLCKAWVWISNVVCVVWTWVSNVVCVAWTWISSIVCVAWAWVQTRTWFWKLVRRLTCPSR